MKSGMTENKKIQDVLDYWHKIEFFIPFDLKQVFEQADEKDLRWLKSDDVSAGAASPWRVDVPATHELTGFHLYLGIFQMQVIADFARELAPGDAADATDDEERSELDGQSCFAKVFLDARGQPAFDRFSVSTVPWALGTAGRSELSALSSSAFDRARRDLAERLANFDAGRKRRRVIAGDDGVSFPLAGDELQSLQALLQDWAGYDLPAHSSIALLEIVTHEKKNQKKPLTSGAGAASHVTSPLPATLSPAPDADENDDDDACAEALSIDILNSFYIEDIERCMTAAGNGKVPATIRSYLIPGDPQQRIDLYSDEGRARIIQALHPRQMTAGHWPEDASRKMSLMQQFAINKSFEFLKTEGVFSVNGPPGTGKTTLLRDMVCENVVRRARELGKLANAADGLETTVTKIAFEDGYVASIRILRPALAGFEMVVASSNNAAVENISTDLPKSRQLGEHWRGVQYLQPVAHKLAAQTGEKNLAKLAPLDVPWGLISCALGNAKNRQRFRDRVFNDWRPKDERGGAKDPQAIWDWVTWHSQPLFQSAKGAFLAADAALQTAIEARLRYAELHDAWADMSQDRFTRPAADAMVQDERCADDAVAMKSQCEVTLQQAEAELADLQEEERLLDRAPPSFFSKLFRAQSARRHVADVSRNAQAQIAARQRVVQCRADAAVAAETVCQTQSRIEATRNALASARATWGEKQAQLAECQQRYGAMRLPGDLNQIESDVVQRDGFWQDAELASLRSGVFVKALELHEAWLAEVAKKGGTGFGGNLFGMSKLLGGARLTNPADAIWIWQSLFMVVPVVSSTFASFARQFRGMGAGSIGWLFIDEAGQAVPQAAVGALWRARRAMVVGDPLQIEPVFTVPTRLIDALGRLSPHTSDRHYSPASVSVQRLADQANPFGTSVAIDGEDPLWIGSPLRVHRRCADPMFSIANRIAYHDKMVFGPSSRAPADDYLNLGNSAWVDVRGTTSTRQAVPAQIEAVAEFIIRLYATSGELPSLYVISPFKAVKKAILDRLHSIDWRTETGRRGPMSKVWERWCRERIGTVHTFQGKEERIVVFVLGADHASAGAAGWAASKPNLLNVAVTRAQHRLFIVGDASLWGGLDYFSEALSQLGTPITAQQWLGRVSERADPVTRA